MANMAKKVGKFWAILSFCAINSFSNINWSDILDLSYFDLLNHYQRFNDKVLIVKKFIEYRISQIRSDPDLTREQRIAHNEGCCFTDLLASLAYIKQHVQDESSFREHVEGRIKSIQKQCPKSWLNESVDPVIILQGLALFLREKKIEIQNIFNSIKINRVGHQLLEKLEGVTSTKKISIRLGSSSQYYHPEGGEDERIEIGLRPCVTPQHYVGGLTEKIRPLDVTLFHELLHCLHFRMQLEGKYDYNVGLTDKPLASQLTSLAPLIVQYFQVDASDVNEEYLRLHFPQWMGNYPPAFPQYQSFYLEEMRTILGDPSCDWLSENLYLASKKEYQMMRVGYCNETPVSESLAEVINNQNIEDWFKNRYDGILNGGEFPELSEDDSPGWNEFSDSEGVGPDCCGCCC